MNPTTFSSQKTGLVHGSSIQNLFYYNPNCICSCSYLSKSLPNIHLLLTNNSSSPCHITDDDCNRRTTPTPSDSNLSTHHHKRPKILKKTWDKVKTIIHPTSSSRSQRGSLRKVDTICRDVTSSPSQGVVLRRANSTSSALVTPCCKSVFDFNSSAISSTCSSPPLQQPQHHLLQQQMSHDSHFYRKSENKSYPHSMSPTIHLEQQQQRQFSSQSPAEIVVAEEESVVSEDKEKIQRNYAQLQKRLSEELHQRMSEYEKQPNTTTTDNLSEDFKKRLQQWEMWKVSTGKASYTDEIKKLLPEDFSKKLQEWESIKTGGGGACSSSNASIASTTTSGRNKKTSMSKASSSTVQTNLSSRERKKKNSEAARQKELLWLDKQLEKIENEKKRLEREMKKYLEREARLEKMKEALKNSPTDVWIRTPTAKCKVEKLSKEFTRKLYEWEEKQGIEFKDSTVALLSPEYYNYMDNDPPSSSHCSHDDNTEPPSAGGSSRGEEDTQALLEVEQQEEEILTKPISSDQDELEEEDESQERNEGTEGELTVEERTYCSHKNRISSTSGSSAEGSDYEEEATDSYATRDKGNSGASNTDSDFYRTEPGSSRRRSSDAISTPLSARSPSLSAFTSDDEDIGLLKTVREKEEDDDNGIDEEDEENEENVYKYQSRTSTLLQSNNKDAGSQTEIITKVKPIVVEDVPNDLENIEQGESTTCTNNNGEELANTCVFVPTKRTIFTPILDEADTEKVLIENDDRENLRSPLLVKSFIHQQQQQKLLDVGHEEEELCEEDDSRSSPPPLTPVWMRLDSPLCYSPPPPKIVGAVRKSSQSSPPVVHEIPIIQQQPAKFIPKLGKIPVWCSPIGARRQFINETQLAATSPLAAPPLMSTQQEFSLDKFLHSNLISETGNETTNSPITTLGSPLVSRIPVISPALARKYTIGGGIPPSQKSVMHSKRFLARSSSFGPRRMTDLQQLRMDEDEEQETFFLPTQQHQHQFLVPGSSTNNNPLVASYLADGQQQQSRCNIPMSKSQSTGSIKSFSRAFANKLGLGKTTAKPQQNITNDAGPSSRKSSTTSTTKSFSSWLQSSSTNKKS